jgi:UDP-N-acetylmuramyl tripeptide synthase
MKDRQLKWQKEKRTKEQTMKYKTQHRKLKMITNDITNQITITIYLLHYLIKLRGLY